MDSSPDPRSAKQEASITVPQHSAPMRIRIPDVSNLAARKVSDQQVIENNMINYPVMYDMQTQRKEEPRRTEPVAKISNMQKVAQPVKRHEKRKPREKKT